MVIVPSVKGPTCALGDKPTAEQLCDILIDKVIIDKIVLWNKKKLTSFSEIIKNRNVMNEIFTGEEPRYQF